MNRIICFYSFPYTGRRKPRKKKKEDEENEQGFDPGHKKWFGLNGDTKKTKIHRDFFINYVKAF